MRNIYHKTASLYPLWHYLTPNPHNLIYDKLQLKTHYHFLLSWSIVSWILSVFLLFLCSQVFNSASRFFKQIILYSTFPSSSSLIYFFIVLIWLKSFTSLFSNFSSFPLTFPRAMVAQWWQVLKVQDKNISSPTFLNFSIYSNNL